MCYTDATKRYVHDKCRNLFGGCYIGSTTLHVTCMTTKRDITPPINTIAMLRWTVDSILVQILCIQVSH